MSFSSDDLLQALDALAENAEPPQRYVVAMSGGLDSTVLLHALVQTATTHNVPLLAVHVDHGLQSESADWAAHCEQTAQDLDVEFRLRSVDVDLKSGKGPEAAARDVRYAALADEMAAGDWLLSAHHQDDQAETMLLNLLRGSGPSGLAGIAPIRRFATGWLARPLLSYGQAELREYATQYKLRWIDDPSNDDRDFDRNFLRHEVLPVIESRWPGAAQRLYRSSRNSADAATLLDELAAADVARLGGRRDCLELDEFGALGAERQRNLLRYAIRTRGLTMPGAAQLQAVIDEVVLARADAMPVLAWGDTEIRRFRNRLYILHANEQRLPARVRMSDSNYLDLGAGLGALRLEHGAERGLDTALLEGGLELRFRQGGEKIRPVDQSHRRTLKNLLNENHIVPWMRDRIPLVYANDKLVAVADLWLAADAVASPGVAIYWDARPPIY